MQCIYLAPYVLGAAVAACACATSSFSYKLNCNNGMMNGSLMKELSTYILPQLLTAQAIYFLIIYLAL